MSYSPLLRIINASSLSPPPPPFIHYTISLIIRDPNPLLQNPKYEQQHRQG